MIKRFLATFALAFAVSAPSSAATINFFEGGVDTDVPGLTGFATTGAMMDGMSVTACFTGIVGCQTRAWTDGGAPDSGGVSGTGWALSLTGDTFSAQWDFEISGDMQLISLLLDGRSGLTIFDRTEPSFGTNGSAQGRDFFTSLNTGTTIDVTYLDPTGVNGADPVGDLFQQVFINFGQTGPRVDWSFVQDTDNDARFTNGKVSEPSTLMLLGFALLALAGTRRRVR